jgi:hypothetical protein
MRYTKYNFEFTKPDKTVVCYIDQTMAQVLETIPALTREFYCIDYKFTRHTVNNLTCRPDVAHTFFKSIVKISRCAPKSTVDTGILSQGPGIAIPQNSSPSWMGLELSVDGTAPEQQADATAP